MWLYRCYVDGEDPNLWEAWYERERDMRGRHDQTFRILSQRDIWTKPHWLQLTSKDGLGEVRLRGGSREWRIFGYLDHGRKEFVVCGIGYHKDNVYTPRNIIDTCVERMKEMQGDEDKAISCNRPGFPKSFPG